MNLTGKQLVELGIITGPIPEENIQPNGVDLNLLHVRRIEGEGLIVKEGKTQLGDRVDCLPIEMWPKSYNQPALFWKLEPGTYDLSFQQGCNIPANQRIEIVHRSSVLRNGGIIVSGIFDSGFKVNHTGSIMVLTKRLVIEVGARVAQAVATGSNFVDKLYDGQWQQGKNYNRTGSPLPELGYSTCKDRA